MSTYLFHLTRKTDDLRALDVLIKILMDKKLNGSTTHSGYIVGKDCTVCFQDVPLYSLCQNSLHEEKYRDELGGKIRYQPVGLGFRKQYVFQKGGRPVIYESSIKAKEFLPKKEEWWRIVDFHIGDGNNMRDWTHEREWRVKGDMAFKISETYVLLARDKQYKYFMENVDFDIIKKLAGIIVLDPILS